MGSFFNADNSLVSRRAHRSDAMILVVLCGQSLLECNFRRYDCNLHPAIEMLMCVGSMLLKRNASFLLYRYHDKRKEPDVVAERSSDVSICMLCDPF